MSERRRIFDLDDMPVERDRIRIFGQLYDLAGPADISAQDMAEIMRLETRIRQREERERPWQEADQELDQEQSRQIEELFELVRFRTRLILASDIADETLDRLSLRQHAFICVSFWEASNAAGRPQEAAPPAGTQTPSASTA